ncbi:MAG: zinc ribbon domain-containing protein [Oscillospiraceae bacterium]
MATSFCPQCGTQVEDSMSFCPKCGTRMMASAASSAAPNSYMPQQSRAEGYNFPGSAAGFVTFKNGTLLVCALGLLFTLMPWLGSMGIKVTLFQAAEIIGYTGENSFLYILIALLMIAGYVGTGFFVLAKPDNKIFRLFSYCFVGLAVFIFIAFAVSDYLSFVTFTAWLALLFPFALAFFLIPKTRAEMRSSSGMAGAGAAQSSAVPTGYTCSVCGKKGPYEGACPICGSTNKRNTYN